MEGVPLGAVSSDHYGVRNRDYDYADHIATTARLSAMVPLLREVGLGGDLGLTFRRSVYRDQPRVLVRVPQVRAYLVWSPS